MEQNRESGNRGGHPGGSAQGERERQSAADGFEGMNYEQRREPYFTSRQQSNRNSAPSNSLGSGDNNNNDHSPV